MLAGIRLPITAVVRIGVLRIRLLVVIEQDAMGGTVEIIELAGADGPEKCRHDNGYQHHRQRDQ